MSPLEEPRLWGLMATMPRDVDGVRVLGWEWCVSPDIWARLEAWCGVHEHPVTPGIPVRLLGIPLRVSEALRPDTIGMVRSA